MKWYYKILIFLFIISYLYLINTVVSINKMVEDTANICSNSTSFARSTEGIADSIFSIVQGLDSRILDIENNIRNIKSNM